MATSANNMPLGKRPGRPGKPPVKKARPRPARHIPWPEIFKHHISLVEGHLKMIEMVRKHTVEGTGNHRTMSNLVDRAHGMLKDAKVVQREFVAPKDAWQSVPIGSSSDTMYPGYSPKDHEYGKAAQEFGKEWSEAKKRGITFDTGPDGPEYQFGQSKGSKKRRLEASTTTESASVAPKSENEGAGSSAPPLFFVDSNPTPIKSLNGISNLKTELNPTFAPKASSKSHEAQDGKASGSAATEDDTPVIEYENIDREVEARLKLKADARENKKNKKRKRESNAPADSAPELSTSLEQPPSKKSQSKKEANKDKTADKDAAPADIDMADAPGKNKPTLDDAATSSADSTSEEDSPARAKKAKKRKDSTEEVSAEHKKKKGRKSKVKE